MRTTAQVFADLGALCQSPGFAHALAYLCFRDNMVKYADEITVKDVGQMFSSDRLIRTEIATLVGLMIQKEIMWVMPSPHVVQRHIDEAESLLKELHQTFLAPLKEALAEEAAGSKPRTAVLQRGDFLREAIFYGGESAYSFQYRDFAKRKYANDDTWLRLQKGFSISEATEVVQTIKKLQEQKLVSRSEEMRALPPDQWSILPGFMFRATEVVERCGLPSSTVAAVLETFTLPSSERNTTFHAPDDFNAANATPLLRVDSEFVVFQAYSLVQALYESPFYWMAADKQYEQQAMRNRGLFTEEFCRERLGSIFGNRYVYHNVDLVESKAKKVGEIDVLVVFADRAIIVQAKSKRLTIEARKGNDRRIREDFQKSVQDSYDQGLSCAQKLSNREVRLVDASGRELAIPTLKEIYLLCVVADHYPALHFQARQFLKYQRTDEILPPLVLDVFALDAIVEMLSSPLRLLSYINRRVGYAERIHATHEHVILSYHLKSNLWIDDNFAFVHLGDDISTDLDIAMTVRREGLNGKRTPDGVLTRFAATAVGRIVAQIEARPDSGVIDFGFLLLALSEGSTRDLSNQIKHIAQLARQDGRDHDLTLYIDTAKTGLTVHCNEWEASTAIARLRSHCMRRKFAQKAKKWFGVCISPKESLRFGFTLDYEWQPDAQMSKVTRRMKTIANVPQSLTAPSKRRRLGRNDPCPCDSGLKYKQCHGK